MDTLDPAQRSKRMSLVRGKNTKVELMARRLVHGLGYRYRLHRRDLPGTPDLVFSKQRKIIFVHGCFWHRHADCSLARLPKSRVEYWLPKLEGNAQRDARNVSELGRLGWDVMTIWECQLRDKARLVEIIRRFLDT